MKLRNLLRHLPFDRFRNPPPCVAVVRLEGTIAPSTSRFRRGFVNLQSVESALERAFSLPNLEAVAISINSPGGSPVQSSLIAGRIRALSEEKDIPVLAFVEDVAASGGYWLACAGDEIFADTASIVGSIGVVSASFGFSDFIARHGIERRVHTAGENKATLDPFRPEDPEDVARLEAIQADIHDAFREWVQTRRGDRLVGDPDELFSGAFWAGGKGRELGLIDGIGDLRGVLRERFGEKVRVINVGGRRSLFRLFSGAEAANAMVEGGLLAIEQRARWSRFGL